VLGLMRMTYIRHTITVDFSGDHERQIAGIGIVIQESTRRGRRGPIVEELAEAVEGIPLGEGEKYAVLRALQVASERGFSDLKIRSDYNGMRRRLRQSYDGKGFQSPEDLDRRILELAAEFDRIHFGFVSKRKNQRAHILARLGRRLPPRRSNEV
jgi:ribonuclease HI